MFTDTHCHLYGEYYDDLENIFQKMKSNQINRVINNGCDNLSNKEVLSLVNKKDFIYGALGIHPESADHYTQEDINFIKNHIHDERIIAIGEIGLDYHYGKENKKKQIELFEKQLALAESVDKPVIIHSRDATQDTINILKKYNVRGVIHSFSGSYETACIYIKMGFLLGINGVITFKNCNLKDVIAKVDLRNLVLETDSPYLTPVPYRGKRNDPSHIMDIARFVADLKNVDLNELSLVTNANIARVFDI